MSINLEQTTTYPIRLGSSLAKRDGIDPATGLASEEGAEEGFHFVSRQLPRTTTKLSRETLENGDNVRARLLGTSARVAAGSDGKRQILLEIDARDQKSTCTYEGEYEPVLSGGRTSVNDDDDSIDDEEVDCVLIYDEESKAFVIERVASSTVIKSGVPSGVNSASTGASAGQLTLPANRHSDLPRDGGVNATAASNRGTPSLLDEASEDELAKELEGILDVTSDDDEFEVVDGSGADTKVSKPIEAEVESLSDRRSDNDDDDDDMVFEEVDPSADLSAGSLGRSVFSANRANSDEEFEEFEDIGTPPSA
ncbi:hypothetical protein GGI02_006091, partial [Coemansia sp. RSA 2322]